MADPRYVLDHISIGARDMVAARAFYDAALGALGFEVVMEFEDAVGYGLGGRPQFFVGPEGKYGARAPMHIAFHAADRARVDAFYALALEAGGRDNGAPGLRSYHPNYYAAFVLDPDNNNVEAVTHVPE